MRHVFFAVMRSWLRARPALALTVSLSAVALLASAGTARAEKIRNHFDSDTMMRAPGFFDLLVLGAPGEAKWLVLSDPNPPSAPNRLAQVNAKRPADSIAAAIRRNAVLQDGTVSTFLKRGAGRAGLILRLKDEKDFLVLLVDPAGGVVLSAYAGGKAVELGHGETKQERPWERYSVKAEGPQLTVFFNDEKLFEARDPHPAAGRTGLAASGPGEASFDEFVIDPAEASAK
jgi:hypothetical protein